MASALILNSHTHNFHAQMYVSGGLLFGPFWKAVYYLDRNGLKVLAVTADVVSTNRCLNKLHSNKVYKEVNHHCRDRRYMYVLILLC